MKNIDPDLLAALINEQYDYCVIVKLTYADGSTVTNTNRDVQVYYDGEFYSPWDFAIESINYSSSMAVDQIAMRFGNADRAFSSVMLAAGDTIGSAVVVTFIAMENNQPMDGGDIVLFSGTVSNFNIVGEKSVSLNVVNHLILWNKRPLRKALSACRWNFQGVECGYGDLIKNRTLTDTYWAEANSNVGSYGELLTDVENMITDWIPVSCGVVGEATTFTLGPPSGGIKLTDNSVEETHVIYHDVISSGGSDPVTFSIFAKKAEREAFQLQIYDTGYSDSIWAQFNLDTGIVYTSGDSGSADLTDVGIIDCGDGCYYCYICGVVNGGGYNRFHIYLLDDSYNITYIGGESENSGMYFYKPHSIAARESDHTPHMDIGFASSFFVEGVDTNQLHYIDQTAACKALGNDFFYGIFARQNSLGGSLSRHIMIQACEASQTHSVYVLYDLDNGAPNGVIENGDGSIIDSGVVDYEKGWYYCWFKCNLGYSVTLPYFRIFLLNSAFEAQYNGVGSWVLLYDAFSKEMNIDVRCMKTYEDCAKYGRTNNFGGFRYLPAITEKVVWWGRTPSF